MLIPPASAPLRGSARWAAWYLVFYGVMWVVPGAIHAFAPDGGAESIAGLAMDGERGVVRALFAWAGAGQIAHGLACIAVGLRYQVLVPLFLALGLVERSIMSWSAWIAHAPASGHHPPGHYGNLVGLVLLVLFLWLSLRRSPREG